MAANVYYEKDADPSIIRSKKVAIIGYGSQGHAHALNLKDSGVEVCVGLRDGSSSKTKAENAGLSVKSMADAAAWADVVMILAPDTEQKKIYDENIAAGLEPGNALAFAYVDADDPFRCGRGQGDPIPLQRAQGLRRVVGAGRQRHRDAENKRVAQRRARGVHGVSPGRGRDPAGQACAGAACRNPGRPPAACDARWARPRRETVSIRPATPSAGAGRGPR